MAVEKWECTACGKLPCRIEIEFDPTPYPHVEDQPRLARKVCLCDNHSTTEWKQIGTEPTDKEVDK